MYVIDRQLPMSIATCAPSVSGFGLFIAAAVSFHAHHCCFCFVSEVGIPVCIMGLGV
jgi:hypothetical protein